MRAGLHFLGLWTFAVLCVAPAVAAEPVFGRWLTDDRAAIVKVERCADRMCGRIERVLDPKAPENDINNPDDRLRSRPLVGALVLQHFVRDGSRWKGGRAYDPKTGNSYRSELRVEADGRLRVTGCVLFLCRSRYWTRYK